MVWYHGAVALAGLLAGLIAAISGFGIGSLLTPVIAYMVTQGRDVVRLWPTLAIATIFVVIGTAIGIRILPRLHTNFFRRTVAILLAALGIGMLFAATLQ